MQALVPDNSAEIVTVLEVFLGYKQIGVGEYRKVFAEPTRDTFHIIFHIRRFFCIKEKRRSFMS